MSHFIDEEKQPDAQTRIQSGTAAYPFPCIETFNSIHNIWCAKTPLLHEWIANVRSIYKPSTKLDLLIKKKADSQFSFADEQSLHKLGKKPKLRENEIFSFLTCTTIHESLTFLKNLAERVTNHQFVDKYYYTYEWRTHGEVPTGLHIHFIIIFNNPRIDSNSLRVFNQFFKRNCKGRVCDARTYPVEPYLKEKIDYINGKTDSIEKNKKKTLDRTIREKYNLIDIYTNAT